MSDQTASDRISPQDVLSQMNQEILDSYNKNRSLMSFEEFLSALIDAPRQHCRSVAQYLRDVFDYFGTETVETPSGPRRRFKLFDVAFDGGRERVIGHEVAQNEIYKALNNFIRERRVTRMVLLHGPNGSAKSSLINALIKALEHYSHLPEGALYRFHWVFPTEKISRSSIGFGGKKNTSKAWTSYAHLGDLELNAKLTEELRDHPLLLIPRAQRQRLLLDIFGGSSRGQAEDGGDAFILSDYLFEGDLSHKSRQIYDALFSSYKGSHSEVLKHIQVERYYISHRYQRGAVIIEPQLRVDARSRQVTSDRSLSALPPSLQNQALFEPQGELVNGNRGVIAFNDFFKRPMEMNRYLLSTSERGAVTVDHAILYIDAFLVSSANESYLEAFKGTPDYLSFKGRLSLVCMPYMLDYTVEGEIYQQLLGSADVARPIAPHTQQMAALWAVLTRLTRPKVKGLGEEIQKILKALSPLEKAGLYAHHKTPSSLDPNQARLLLAHLPTLLSEGTKGSEYEGRRGVSPREMKSFLLRAGQRTDYQCLGPLALLEELREVIESDSVYPFLRVEADGDYSNPKAFLDVVRGEYLELLDVEIRDCMGLIEERQYEEYFAKYIQHVSHKIRGEKILDPLTGRSHEPSVSLLEEVEEAIGAGEKFRGDVISRIAAFRIDNPDAKISYEQIFPEAFEALRRDFYRDRKRQVQTLGRNLHQFLSGDDDLLEADLKAVQETLGRMYAQRAYCEASAQEAVGFLIQERYSD